MKISGITLIFLFIIMFLNSPAIHAQDLFGVGVNFGAGTISGNLPSQGSFNTSVFIEGNPGFSGNYLLRLTYFYVSDMNVLLPTLTARYTPFLRGMSLKGIQSQAFDNSMYSEEGLGVVAVNDRTYASTNNWDYGIAFSLLVGLDLRHSVEKGFKIGVGAEYGLTFTNTDVRFLAVYLQSILFF
jgi:hypothetical protein